MRATRHEQNKRAARLSVEDGPPDASVTRSRGIFFLVLLPVATA
jgi:hypothetical protein